MILGYQEVDINPTTIEKNTSCFRENALLFLSTCGLSIRSSSQVGDPRVVVLLGSGELCGGLQTIIINKECAPRGVGVTRCGTHKAYL